MRRKYLVPFAIPAMSLLAFAAGDPLTVDPGHYHLEIDNQWARVYREHIEPHGKLIMHQHPQPGAVVVYLTDQNVRQTLGDGTVRMLNHKRGDAAWFPATAHESVSLSDAPYECIQIEPKKPAAMLPPLPPEKTDPVVTEPNSFHVVFENDLVRVLRVKVGPNEKAPMHKHPGTSSVVVYLTDQDMRQSHADGVWRESHNKAGSVKWVPKDAAHQDEDIGGKGFELIRVELKQAR